jgi:multiple sugar transport system permease protein
MTAATDTSVAGAGILSNPRTVRALDVGGLIITIVTVIFAIFWAFPLYWAVVTTLKPEYEVIEPGIGWWPKEFTLAAYIHVFVNTTIGGWYINSLVTGGLTTIGVVSMSALCGYALSQLSFPGRRLLWWMILASFMVPVQALIVNHFFLAAQFSLINNWLGVVLPQLIAPVTVIVYKQFFDSIPREMREAAVMDGANEFHVFSRVYLPMNWGITTALAIITFIGAWNAFFWPFLVAMKEPMMNVAVGIVQVHDAFGVQYARVLAGAMMAGLPVAVVYLIFQRKVTQAIMLTAGIKG